MRVIACSLLTLSCFGASYTTASNPRVLAFEARKAEYVAQGAGYALSVTTGGAVLNLRGHAVGMSVAGASPRSSLEALDRMPGKANYLLGRGFRASYDLYGRVRWRGVNPGIDVVFRGNQERLEYDFEIGAGRDPGRIRLAFDGIEAIRIDPNGDLVLGAGALRIYQPKPVAYQVVAGQRQPVDAAYWIDASNHVRFRTGAFDRGRPLVIDPQIVFDEPFGGSGVSTAAGLARDTQGHLYVVGTTNSTDIVTVNPAQGHLGTAPLLVTADAGKTWSFPLLAGATDVTAVVAAPSAPLVEYAVTPAGVFRSANGGTSWTQTASAGLASTVTALAVDSGSPNTLYGATSQGVFVSTDGAASWRASSSGTSVGYVAAIAAHPTQAGTVLAGTMSPAALFRSTDFGQTWTQVLSVSQPYEINEVASIAIAPNGTIIAGTYLGLQISTDGGNAWTAGASQGVESNRALAFAPGNPSTFYMLNASGLQRSSDGGKTLTMLLPALSSTTSSQYIGTFAVDPRNPGTLYAGGSEYTAKTGTTYVLFRSTDGGQTWSQISLPYQFNPQSLFVSPADSRVFVGALTFNSVFVTKWSPDGSQVLYSTYLGGSGGDTASGIAVDGTGSAYITGYTSSPDFPTTGASFQTTPASFPEAFVAKLSPDGSQLVYSTLLGGGWPRGIAVDNAGSAVIAGLTQGSYPVTANAFQTAPYPGCITSVFNMGEAFVTRIAADGKSLIYSTLLGGSCPNANSPEVAPATYATSVALDASGNAWVTGATLSPDFPVTSNALQPKFGGGLYDGFLARFNPAGGLDYATYLGGTGYDALNAIAFDPSGNIYLAGQSLGLSQPASAGAFQSQAGGSCPVFTIGPSFPGPQGSAFVLKLDPKAHSVQRLSYLGGALCLSPSSIAVDSAGEPWISGGAQYYPSAPQTVSPFEIGIGQGFIGKFSADFTQLPFSTYFDPVAGLATDSSGFAYAAGTAASNATTATQAVYIAKIDPTPPPISLDSVESVVPSTDPYPSGFPGIAAGEAIRILGRQIGPATATPGVIQSGALASTVAGVEVTFDGTPVPLLWVSAQEIDLVAPFELATKSATTIQVQNNGVKSNPVQVAVTGTVLQILGVFNGDFSPNSASNPAHAGSTMILYLAGAGQTNPPSRDGQVNAAPLAAPAAPIQIQPFTDDPANPTGLPVAFAGAAPGMAAGILQVNFVAPRQSLTYVTLSMGNAYAFFNVWVK